MWRNWKPHTPQLGIQNSAVMLENNLAVLQKVKHRVIILIQQFHSLVCTPEKNEKLQSHKNAYTNVHSSIIHNSQKVETTQTSIN